MSKAAKAENLAFEEALKKLEAVLESFEGGELPLESLVERYAEGTQLIAICQAKLADAELKIQRLERNEAGEPKLTPLTADLSEAESS
jgi:exodeoxyribonuclease VII small subunit